MRTPAASEQRLNVLKALGDDTRYAIYGELSESSAALSTAQLAERLGLHVNTVRPHLERMRDVGLLEVSSVANGNVGRPQHRYALRSDAPALGLEPPAMPSLARTLLRLADDVGAGVSDAVVAGRAQGREDANATPGPPGPAGLAEHLEASGFDPQTIVAADSTTISFASCPFDDMAAANPTLVCGMHKGMVDGFVAARGGCSVGDFRSRDQGGDCQVELHHDPAPRAG